MSKKCVIVSGGSIDDSFAIQMIEKQKPDCVIGVDSGLNFLYRNEIMPTHIVGDFDSVDPRVIEYYKKEVRVPIREFDPVKDATDTEIAVRLAIELGAQELWILGATGTRLDHVYGNIQILKLALDHGIQAWIVDEYNRISLWSKEVRLTDQDSFGQYFSIFPFGEVVEEVSIRGAKYPLTHYRMTNQESRCVSNERIEEEVVITFSEGVLILMETAERK